MAKRSKNLYAKPGDLALAICPDGELRFTEIVTETHVGYGDVLFEVDPSECFLFCSEGRTAGIDALIGQSFADGAAAKAVLLSASAPGYQRHRAFVKSRTDEKASRAAWVAARGTK